MPKAVHLDPLKASVMTRIQRWIKTVLLWKFRSIPSELELVQMSRPTAPCHCDNRETPPVGNRRNLAVFIDGTSNGPGDQTNVLKLYRQVEEREGTGPGSNQLYLWGLGKYEKVNKSLRDHLLSPFEVAFAVNVEKNVKTAYSWLVDKYQDGDRVYLFGFSRGAYQVRSLVSMIHDVGLVKNKEHIDTAYGYYRSIDVYHDETKRNANQFKRKFCRSVRIHFVGVWDTVSSLGLIKRDVQITSSASVTNACHFRHALALDERRVKFMPEYFLEINAHRISGSPRLDANDVKEVWFAGSHSDVGGMRRKTDGLGLDPGSNGDDHLDPIHAGNVSLLWMKWEATECGLVFKEEEKLIWVPGDIDQGTTDSMTFWWGIVEKFPIRHQVSFCGTGKHKRRWHLAHPRSVIPHQQIHFSISTSGVYMPRATLEGGVNIPIVPHGVSGELWMSELGDGETTRLLTSLLRDRQRTPESLDKVLFLLKYRLDKGFQTQITPAPQWFDNNGQQSDSDTLALVIVRDLISPSFVSGGGDLKKMIANLMAVLERPAKEASSNLFLLVMGSLCYLLKNGTGGQKKDVADQLGAKVGGVEIQQTRLSMVLRMKEPAHLVESLRMIKLLAQQSQEHLEVCRNLKDPITKLAEEGSPVGLAAVETLVELKVSLSDTIPFTNILGYLCNALNTEVGCTSPPDNGGGLELSSVLQASGELDEEIMSRFLSAIESRNAHERTAATKTLVRLCRNETVRTFCKDKEVFNTFTKQLERKEVALLASYALKLCIEQRCGLEEFLDFEAIAGSIVAMLNKGWFDGAIGQVEGSKIFDGLMDSERLRKIIINDLKVLDALVRNLEAGKRHKVRMSLICLDSLGKREPMELDSHVKACIENMRDTRKKTWIKSVRILSALAQTEAGEQAIEPHLNDIMELFSVLPRAQWTGPISVVYDLCKNENLRREIASKKFKKYHDLWKAPPPHR